MHLKQTRNYLFGFERRCAFAVISSPDCLFQTNTSRECPDPLQDSSGNANNSQCEQLLSLVPDAHCAGFHVIPTVHAVFDFFVQMGELRHGEVRSCSGSPS